MFQHPFYTPKLPFTKITQHTQFLTSQTNGGWIVWEGKLDALPESWQFDTKNTTLFIQSCDNGVVKHWQFLSHTQKLFIESADILELWEVWIDQQQAFVEFRNPFTKKVLYATTKLKIPLNLQTSIIHKPFVELIDMNELAFEKQVAIEANISLRTQRDGCLSYGAIFILLVFGTRFLPNSEILFALSFLGVGFTYLLLLPALFSERVLKNRENQQLNAAVISILQKKGVKYNNFASFGFGLFGLALLCYLLALLG
jgi:hypothetical protein